MMYAHMTQQPDEYSSIGGPITKSLIGHTIILLVMIFGIPFFMHHPEILTDPVPIEVLSSAEFSEIEKKAEVIEETKVEEVEPPPMKKEMPTMKAESAPAPPAEAVPLPEAKEQEEAPEPVKKVKAPLPMEKPRVKPVEKTEKAEEKPKPDENNFNSLLKNLAENEDQSTPQTETVEPSSGPNVSKIVDNKLSYGEQNAVLAQLAKCWNVPTGARYAEDLIVDLRLVINPDRTVQSAKVVDQGRYNRDSFYRAAADTALRAVRNPSCSPLELPPEKYQEWRYLRLTFDPSNML
jgi:outer membrane biosynthesis protein TonB